MPNVLATVKIEFRRSGPGSPEEIGEFMDIAVSYAGPQPIGYADSNEPGSVEFSFSDGALVAQWRAYLNPRSK